MRRSGYFVLFFVLLNFFSFSCNSSDPKTSGANKPTELYQTIYKSSSKDIPSSDDSLNIEVENPETLSEFEQVMIDSGLVNIQDLDPGILVDLKYSSQDNFLKTDVYGELNKAYLRPLTAERLSKAKRLLQTKRPDLTLLVFDGARPRRVQQIMWDTLQIPFKINYLANPAKGSVHNYGLAVDLTLADTHGIELDMGTPFDFFGELAQPQLEAKFLANGQLSQKQADNRHLLKSVMKEAGFYPIKTEWWHFNTILGEKMKSRYGIIE